MRPLTWSEILDDTEVLPSVTLVLSLGELDALVAGLSAGIVSESLTGDDKRCIRVVLAKVGMLKEGRHDNGTRSDPVGA